MASVKAYRYTLYSQLSLGVFLLVCLILQPHYLFERNEGGMSNFGIHWPTVVPYSLAFWSCGLLILQAARHLPSRVKSYRSVRAVLILLSAFAIITVLTTYPYKLNDFFDNLHVYAEVASFILELPIGFWFAIVLLRDRLSIVLLLALVSGFVFALLTYLGVLHVLFLAQAITLAAFGTLLVRTIRQQTHTEPSE